MPEIRQLGTVRLKLRYCDTPHVCTFVEASGIGRSYTAGVFIFVGIGKSGYGSG